MWQEVLSKFRPLLSFCSVCARACLHVCACVFTRALQLIDCSMAVPEDPKEPHFSSVLPWIVLYRIIKHEEAAFDCLLRQHMPPEDDGRRSSPLTRLLQPLPPATGLNRALPVPQTTRTRPCCPTP